MKNRHLVFGLVGIAAGFVLGFFTSDLLRQNQAPVQTAASQQMAAQGTAEGELPQDHPSMDDMQRLHVMQQKAEANPQDAQIRVALGNAYYDMQRFDAAIKWYEQAVQLDPNNPNMITDLGTCYLYTNNPAKAVELYERSLKLDPKHAQTLQNLGFAHFSVSHFSDAIKVWERLLTLHPEYQQRAEITKQIEAAQAHLKTASNKSTIPGEKAETSK